jgi:ribosomal protein S27AE
MSRDEAGIVGNDEQDARLGERRPGTMADAEVAAADEVAAERAQAADAGDQGAQAEQADVGTHHDTDATRIDAGRPGAMRHAAEWLDGKLVPKLGPADLGPYDVESDESVRTHDVCPLCGHPMGEHQIDRSHHNAVLICPAERIPEVEHYEPLNEVGMPKRSAQGES